MEMIKLLNEAEANGLSKEEFFHLIDLEIKMNESKKQTSGASFSSSDVTGSATVGLETLLQDIQQGLRELFEEQKQQLQDQFQHMQQCLQQQQESHFKLIQQQQHSVKQNELQEHDVQRQRYLTRKLEGNLDQAVKDMKDTFVEVRNTVLNQIEEEKLYVKEAQNDTMTQLSRTGEDVSHVKEGMVTDTFARMEKQIEQVQLIYEQQLQTNLQEDHRDTSEGGSQITQDSLMTLVEDLGMSIEKKLESAVDSLKKELQEIKKNNMPVKVLDIEAKDDSPQQPDVFLYYFYINSFFEKCTCSEQFIENMSIYVEKLQRTMRGCIQFVDGEMEVWLAEDSTPSKRKYGPLQSYVDFRYINFKVTIIDVTEKLPAKEIGQERYYESRYIARKQPSLIGSIRCDKVMKEGYNLHKSGAVLLKCEIFVEI